MIIKCKRLCPSEAEEELNDLGVKTSGEGELILCRINTKFISSYNEGNHEDFTAVWMISGQCHQINVSMGKLDDIMDRENAPVPMSV